MTKAARMIKVRKVSRSTRETVLKEATLAGLAQRPRPTLRAYWARLFVVFRHRMAKRIGRRAKKGMPRAVWRSR